LIAQNPSEDKLLDLARTASERGNLDLAFKLLRRAAEIEPNREDSYLEFSSICADHESDALALKVAEIGLGHVPGSYRLTVQKGVVLAKLGNYSEAVRLLRSAVMMQTNNRDALASLAIALSLGGDNAEASRVAVKALGRFPSDYYLHYLRGKLLLQESGSDSHSMHLAQIALEKSVQLNPNYADSFYQLSLVYSASSPKLGERALENCLKLNPKHLPAMYALGRLYSKEGQKAKGQAVLAEFQAEQKSEEQRQGKRLLIQATQ
jgi:tetratricopeptide (TPR) repeat protein